MDKNTVYILQKDLPYVKAGVEYKFDGEHYVCDETSKFTTDIYSDRLHKKSVENNLEWFKPKEQVKESKPTEQFQWTNELINEYVENCVKASQMNENYVSPETFIQSKSKTEQPKEEQVPIKVQMISFYTSMSEKLIRDVFSVRLTGDISEDKLQSIKEAIEGVLNGDNGNLVSLLRDCVSATWGCKDFKHTQDMFDKFLSDRKLLKKSI